MWCSGFSPFDRFITTEHHNGTTSFVPLSLSIIITIITYDISSYLNLVQKLTRIVYSIFTMSTETATNDKGFPWFEEKNFGGWLVQFRAHLRRTDSHMVLDTACPTDLDANGVPIVMTAAQRREFNEEVLEWKAHDNIAFSDIMKACRPNPAVKSLCESENFESAGHILARLRRRYHNVDEIHKAGHLLKYHALKMDPQETGPQFVDRERRSYLALREMGVNLDDSIRLTKFIQDKTTNSEHRQLAQTIFSTPQMTLDRAASLFETYHPASEELSVSALTTDWCKYCKKKGHLIGDCRKKKSNDKKKRTNKSSEKNFVRRPCKQEN
jgi:hypothetical protein